MSIFDIARQNVRDLLPSGIQAIVCTTEDEWLAHRRDYVTASEVACLLGASKWDSPYSLYCRKVNGVSDQLEGERLYWGHRQEPIIAHEYRKETGRPVWNLGPYTIVSNPDYPVLGATCDRFTKYANEHAPLECKNMDAHNAKDWEFGIPLKVQIQANVQMMCTATQRASVAVLIGGNQWRYMDFEIDTALCADILAAANEFYRRCVEQNPPPIDGTEPTRNALLALHPDDTGAVVLLPPEALDLDVEREFISEQIKELEQRHDALTNQICATLGAATYGVVGKLKYTWKTVEKVPRVAVDLFQFCTGEERACLGKADLAVRATKAGVG
jgi:putative phage-type endonuclease